MNRKILAGLTLGLFLAWTAGMAEATPVVFDVADGPSSSVSITNKETTLGYTTLTAALVAGLDGTQFTLSDGQEETFDFFTLTAAGLGSANAVINATLAFDLPGGVTAIGNGGVDWFTVWGIVTGTSIEWNRDSLPDVFYFNGTTISIDFKGVNNIDWGSRVTVQATVTNLGTTPYSVPEPSVMMLLGTSVLGLCGISRRKKK